MAGLMGASHRCDCKTLARSCNVLINALYRMRVLGNRKLEVLGLDLSRHPTYEDRGRCFGVVRDSPSCTSAEISLNVKPVTPLI